jgi:purine-nucleoside phosphorylase
MPTPHIAAQPGDFADVVLMPGDPQRAELIATTFLTDARRVTNVRNVCGYTGTYQGRRLSVMAHGMGIPSCSIYATELIKDFGVRALIRVGSCGVLSPDLKLGDVIVAMGASTDSKVNRVRFLGHDFAPVADYAMLVAAVEAAGRLGIPVRVGGVFSSDLFYTPQPEVFDAAEKLGILGVEMETAGLYGAAAEYGARALSLLSVSDHIRRGEHLDAEARRSSFDAMIRIALEATLKI